MNKKRAIANFPANATDPQLCYTNFEVNTPLSIDNKPVLYPDGTPSCVGDQVHISKLTNATGRIHRCDDNLQTNGVVSGLEYDKVFRRWNLKVEFCTPRIWRCESGVQPWIHQLCPLTETADSFVSHHTEVYDFDGFPGPVNPTTVSKGWR